MNYIKLLTAAMECFVVDNRLNPTHVSMYLALFQYWNLNRFENPVSISRKEIMKLSKIGSLATYHKCIKNLHEWNYLEYVPSHNPFKGSLVNMFNLDTSSVQALIHYRSDSEQALAHNNSFNEQALVPSKTNTNNKHYKYKRQPQNLEEVNSFFLIACTEQNRNENSKTEAEKFFNYYESNGWKVGGKTDMKDWKAAARNWIIKANESKQKQTSSALVQKRDNLNTTTNKNYNEPL
ncbi:transcriptional regulator [Aureibaculum sp. 2210JD6-5]|uniref:transcriptional regulator n=1 Tax=Aureibaculum sp. 2210JD6-5 TaxID=3103957 RepID=UPI002AADDE57|nr:transcriptional regulator [Aureibaculum sp. 2210JD6-5]MDY7397028.1 transcriptional regulator [Aureibaculum sp. 2210JD6-5]